MHCNVIFGLLAPGGWQVLLESLPRLVDAAESQLGIDGVIKWFRDQWLAVLESGGLVVNVASYSACVFTGAAYLLVVVSAAIYLALSPKVYLEGFLRLIPAAGVVA